MLFPTGFQLLKKALVVISGCIQSKVKTLRLQVELNRLDDSPEEIDQDVRRKMGDATREFVIAINHKSCPRS